MIIDISEHDVTELIYNKFSLMVGLSSVIT